MISLTGDFEARTEEAVAILNGLALILFSTELCLQNPSFYTVPHCRGFLAAELDPQHHNPAKVRQGVLGHKCCSEHSIL